MVLFNIIPFLGNVLSLSQQLIERLLLPVIAIGIHFGFVSQVSMVPNLIMLILVHGLGFQNATT